MELVYERCCGLDVHKKMVVACVIVPDETGQRKKELQTFRTTTRELFLLRDWLVLTGCTHIAMEATGVYWKPVYNCWMEPSNYGRVNARHIKAVPGRKTDVRDAEWIADLLQHGLLTGSFIPPAEQRELRELTRYRTSLVQERARAVNRLQKTLEDTNLKLGDVATDILGKSARAMLEAMLAEQTDPALLADLARGRRKREACPIGRSSRGCSQATPSLYADRTPGAD
jgi:transposase